MVLDAVAGVESGRGGLSNRTVRIYYQWPAKDLFVEKILSKRRIDTSVQRENQRERETSGEETGDGGES